MNCNKIIMAKRAQRFTLKRVGVKKMCLLYADKAANNIVTSNEAINDAFIFLINYPRAQKDFDYIESKLKLAESKYKIFEKYKAKISKLLAKKHIQPSPALEEKRFLLDIDYNDYMDMKQSVEDVFENMLAATFPFKDGTIWEKAGYNTFNRRNIN